MVRCTRGTPREMRRAMGFLSLLNQAAGKDRNGVLLVACLSGFGQTLILVLINEAVATSGTLHVQRFILFVLALILYVLCTRRTYDKGVQIVESLAHRLRHRIVKQLERVELEDLEALGTADIFEQLTESTATLSESADNVAYFLQTAFTLLFAAAYLAWLFPSALVLLAFLFAVALGLYRLRLLVIRARLQQLATARSEFIERLNDLLLGFKEVLLNRRRALALHEDLQQASSAIRLGAHQTAVQFFDNQLHAYVAGFAVLAAIGFVVPRHFEIQMGTLAQLISSALYFRGVAYGVAVGFPAVLHSQHALQSIQSLEQKLAAAARPTSSDEEDPWAGQITSIEAQDLEYAYRGGLEGKGFHIGPVRLTVKPGEIVFLVGTNGSGKSTLLKVLAGLYVPSVGSLVVNGVAVDGRNRKRYRQLISSVFADFHLFTKLYGLSPAQKQAVPALLTKLGLANKTSLVGDAFVRQELSTGQRKRLALVAALAEDRPLYVFDEWAADQDPTFRRYFYEEILPSLRQKGKAVIAVSHDDRYFHCADRLVRMQSGQLAAVEDLHDSQTDRSAETRGSR